MATQRLRRAELLTSIVSEEESVAGLEETSKCTLIYLYDIKNKPYVYRNKICDKLPTIYDIRFNKIYWQETVTYIGTLYLWSLP